jgi:hypothetical protein
MTQSLYRCQGKVTTFRSMAVSPESKYEKPLDHGPTIGYGGPVLSREASCVGQYPCGSDYAIMLKRLCQPTTGTPYRREPHEKA